MFINHDDKDEEMKMKMKTGSIDVRVIEIVFECVVEIGIGELAVHGDDALTEDLEWINVVDVHGHSGRLVVHVCEEVHRHCSHLPLGLCQFGFLIKYLSLLWQVLKELLLSFI
ncbi:hypothetical protein CMV_001075 [Castanea mollissima]|uniref:Uncharacterized protein n=1 Tax=Castanea mollissima TaxID=60419 RepID=A0A8J4S0D7_9ROSI|nr:hypothetical protein CMV_001075 [Castanea mollissima]